MVAELPQLLRHEYVVWAEPALSGNVVSFNTPAEVLSVTEPSPGPPEGPTASTVTVEGWPVACICPGAAERKSSLLSTPQPAADRHTAIKAARVMGGRILSG